MTGLDGSRRDFLKAAGALPAAAAAAAPPAVPQIRLGRHTISRVICGANPFNAGSHLSVFFNQELKRYYTPEQVLKTLNRCQQVGINCWQSTSGNLDLHRRLLDEGGKLSFLSLEAAESTEDPGPGPRRLHRHRASRRIHRPALQAGQDRRASRYPQALPRLGPSGGRLDAHAGGG